MKRLVIVLLILPTLCFADSLGWEIKPDGMVMREGLISGPVKALWNSEVGRVTGVTLGSDGSAWWIVGAQP